MQVDIKQSQHLVFGAGLIGCYLGGVLSYLGLNTRLVCRVNTTPKARLFAEFQDKQIFPHQKIII